MARRMTQARNRVTYGIIGRTTSATQVPDYGRRAATRFTTSNS